MAQLGRSSGRLTSMLACGRRTAANILAFAIVALLAAVPLAGGAGAQEAEERKVEVNLLGFSPASISIETGTTIVWENTNLFNYPVLDGFHQVVADDGSFESPNIAPGASWAYRFLEPGTFTYHDANHPNLTGTVEVTGDPIVLETPEQNVDIVEPDANDPPSWTYDPADVVVETGTKLIWRNTGGTPHTVTADDGTFDSGDMPPGSTFEFTVEKAGVISYSCTPHPWMTASIRIAAPGEAPPPPPPATTKGGSGGGAAIEVPQQGRTGSGPQTWNAKIVEPQISDPQSWTYVPNQIKARTGDTVVWTNTGSVDHTVTADDGSFDSADLSTDQTYQRTFSTPGVYRYSCTPHPWMKGVVVVADDPSSVQSVGLEAEDASGGGASGGGDQVLALGPPQGAENANALPDVEAAAGGNLAVAIAVEIVLIAMAAAWVALAPRPAEERTG